MLVDKESEKHKWIDALHELHRIIRRNKIPHRNVFQLLVVMLANFILCLAIDITKLSSIEYPSNKHFAPYK